MRKVQIIAIPLLIALFVLGACAPTTAPPTPPTPPTPPPGGEEELAPPTGEEEEVTPPTPSKPHFTSNDGRIEFALDNVQRTKVWPTELEPQGEYTPKEGHDFIIIVVALVRITDGHFDSGIGSTLVDDKGGEYQGYRGMQGSWTVSWLIPLDRFELLEGSEGTFIYEVPENVEPVKLRLVYEFFESWSEEGQRESEEEGQIDIILP